MTPQRSILTLLLMTTLAACNGREPAKLDGAPPSGTLGGPCRPGGSCDAGLQCVQQICRAADGGTGGDGPFIPDLLTVLPDGYGPIWPCTTPGKACNAHDPCAINAICDESYKCRPMGWQNCDDGLSCTEDSCAGMGLCTHKALPGSCALADPSTSPPTVRCYKSDERQPGDPCKSCDPAQSTDKWSPVNGGACDDGNPCTKDDYCQIGTCKGINFANQCEDNFACTENLCDGQGGCLGNPLLPDWCLINGTCVKHGTKHPDGSCTRCDVSVSQSAWSPMADTCTIGGQCYVKGDLHPGGCAECNPAKSTTKWTINSGSACLIADNCVTAGTLSPDGCGSCDPSQNGIAWTPLPQMCVINGACHGAGAPHPGGCAACDPQSSTTAWTVTAAGTCLIDNTCHQSGATDVTGCGSCDPQSSTTAWTPLPQKCLIDGICHADGAQHPGGCATCDVAQDPGGWTIKPGAQSCVIGGSCYASGATDPLGCASCDPATDPYSWTPTPGCFNVVLAALNEAHDGNLGGIAGADAMCAAQAQAAGYSGTFKAFLSDSTHNVKDLLTGTAASSTPVLNAKGEKLYDSWDQLFTMYKWPNTSLHIYTFKGTKVDENTVTPTWYDAQAWNGSTVDGQVRTGYTCGDWSSNAPTSIGGGGELDPTYQAWPGTLSNPCDRLLAVVCVQTGP